MRKQAAHSLAKELHEKPSFDPAQLTVHCKQLENLAPDAEGRLIPSLPGTQRLALYTQSDDLFAKQLESETTTMRKLNKVALQTSLLGPVIGGQLMTQGILGTYGYYKYPTRPRKTNQPVLLWLYRRVRRHQHGCCRQRGLVAFQHELRT